MWYLFINVPKHTDDIDGDWNDFGAAVVGQCQLVLSGVESFRLGDNQTTIVGSLDQLDAIVARQQLAIFRPFHCRHRRACF